MAIVQPSSGGEAPELEDDIYTVLCLGVDERVVEDDKFGNAEKLEFHLKVVDKLDADGHDIVLDPRINKKWSEKATLFKYAVAFGLKVSPNEPIDTDQFQGLEARAVISTETPGTWPRVKDLMPVKGKAGTVAARTVSALNPTDPDFDGFWRRIKAIGFEPKDVLPYVDHDLRNVQKKTQAQLDKIAEEMGA